MSGFRSAIALRSCRAELSDYTGNLVWSFRTVHWVLGSAIAPTSKPILAARAAKAHGVAKVWRQPHFENITPLRRGFAGHRQSTRQSFLATRATASTQRPSPSGKHGPLFATCGQGRRSRDRRFCRAEEEAVVVAFPEAYFVAAGRLPLCSAAHDPAYLRPHPFTGVCNTTGSPGCRRSKAKPPPSASSRPIRSAIFISTSPKFELRKASSTSSSPSTERQSSHKLSN